MRKSEEGLREIEENAPVSHARIVESSEYLMPLMELVRSRS
jgi:hypothetical protein